MEIAEKNSARLEVVLSDQGMADKSTHASGHQQVYWRPSLLESSQLVLTLSPPLDPTGPLYFAPTPSGCCRTLLRPFSSIDQSPQSSAGPLSRRREQQQPPLRTQESTVSRNGLPLANVNLVCTARWRVCASVADIGFAMSMRTWPVTVSLITGSACFCTNLARWGSILGNEAASTEHGLRNRISISTEGAAAGLTECAVKWKNVQTGAFSSVRKHRVRTVPDPQS